MGKPESIPDHLLLPDRRQRQRDRRLMGNRRKNIRWEQAMDKGDRRRRRRDRRRAWRGSQNKYYRAP